jgi:hypothetical protein
MQNYLLSDVLTNNCVVFDVARARGGYQTAGLNKSGSSIFGSQTANATPPTPATAFASSATPPNA